MKLYDEVTASIINHLKEGVPPWVKCWKGGSVFPHNAITGREYSGINTLILGIKAMDKGYSGGWLTFQQANALKAHVRKGEKATTVTFTKFIDKEQEDGTTRKQPVVKAYSVFAKEQIEGLPADKTFTLEPPADSHAAATELLTGTGARIIYGGVRACYLPQRDEIHLPAYGSFVDDAAFFGTALHELAHWGGSKERLNRVFGKRFGDRAYAQEEMISELTSAFLCARLGIPATFRSAQYLQAWIATMEEDHRAIFSAASHASQCANYLWEKGYHEVNENTPECEAQGATQAA
jgi:antirestriction protein ArdC